MVMVLNFEVMPDKFNGGRICMYVMGRKIMSNDDGDL